MSIAAYNTQLLIGYLVTYSQAFTHSLTASAVTKTNSSTQLLIVITASAVTKLTKCIYSFTHSHSGVSRNKTACCVLMIGKKYLHMKDILEYQAHHVHLPFH